MGYFRELPDLQYQSFLTDKKSSQDYLLVKNLFRRVKLRDDLQNVFTLFNKYEIVDGTRPELVAEELYGDPELDWVVLITAGITNVRDEWPLSIKQLYDYCEQKYGVDGLTEIRFYETLEVRDSKKRLIMPEGKVVDSNFTISYYDEEEDRMVSINPVTPVTNYEYETRLNDKKSLIYTLKPTYLQQFLSDSREIMLYDQSSQYINDRLIKTENTNSSRP
jgi:hypothetical protein